MAAALVAAFVLGGPSAALAGGKLLATGGATEIEGAAGGGIVPWALIASYATRDEVGGTGFYTHINLPNYTVDSLGVAVGINDRLELSYARQSLSISNGVTTPVAAFLKLPVGTLDGSTISQDIISGKIKLVGSAVYDQNSPLPQIALGVQHKVNGDFKSVLGVTGIPVALGAKHASSTDFYLAFTKLYLAGIGGYNLLLNGTVRLTKANYNGLLGFGGDKNDEYNPNFEGSVAVLFNPSTALGFEYRMMPDNLTAVKADAWKDIFLAYFPNKHLAFLFVYAALGNFPSGICAGPPACPGPGISKQQTNGLFLSGQVSF